MIRDDNQRVNKKQQQKEERKFLYLFVDEIVGEIVIFLRDCFPSSTQ